MGALGSFPLLEVTILLPLFGALSLLLISDEDEGAVRGATLSWSVFTFLVSLPLFWFYDPGQGGFQFERTHEWLPPLGASLSFGADGISVLLYGVKQGQLQVGFVFGRRVDDEARAGRAQAGLLVFI